ncbi:hypothetical protein LTR47_000675 [Exophiala xenobiotica]|nr:hypothetical protein LTR92_002698 [Exophiala xenobiotica]KAK5536146.1 hypothetical protein LTR23_008167 [Chaetothyriales sp. CCFEE 6169]KAK5238932.1 hypothetical protein LTR47_000675 [Exophiala xenobiotica]KAK5255854.1 hypothetical protein LTS06_000310 [Exophiala xenobiotica]KAK5302569.1 hypothetical protein LTR14_000818 [Exophiala xenobiotica]
MCNDHNGQLRRFLDELFAMMVCFAAVFFYKILMRQRLSIREKSLALTSRAQGDAAAVRRECYSRKTPDGG